MTDPIADDATARIGQRHPEMIRIQVERTQTAATKQQQKHPQSPAQQGVGGLFKIARHPETSPCQPE